MMQIEDKPDIPGTGTQFASNGPTRACHEGLRERPDRFKSAAYVCFGFMSRKAHSKQMWSALPSTAARIDGTGPDAEITLYIGFARRSEARHD